MLVEDSRTQAIQLTDVLEKEGWEVIWAPTAQKAMEEIDRAPPDLILLDYYLPGMRGDELCRRIRMNIDTRSIPILMLTTEASNEAEVRGLESGADDFVPKSVDPGILLVRIRALLNKARGVLKPMKQADLLDAALQALNTTSVSGRIAATQVAGGVTRPLRVLVVDDGLVNQRVAMGLLQRRGHSVVLANNGVE